MQIINPATEEIIAEIPQDKAEALGVKFQMLQKPGKTGLHWLFRPGYKYCKNFHP